MDKDITLEQEFESGLQGTLFAGEEFRIDAP